jgi:hypothetical protein
VKSDRVACVWCIEMAWPGKEWQPFAMYTTETRACAKALMEWAKKAAAVPTKLRIRKYVRAD